MKRLGIILFGNNIASTNSIMNENYDHELIMTQREYERTGRQIRVPEDELISVVLDRIDHYLTLHPRERRNYPDPRRDPVVTRIASGKTIEIPQQLVDKALEIHQACGRVGTVERMESVGEHSDMASAHTRLAKRERYAKADPFVMNRDLQGLTMTGRDGRVAGDPTFNDYPERYRDFNRSMAGQISRDAMASDLYDKADPYDNYSHARGAAHETRSRKAVGSFKYGQRSLAHNAGPGPKGGKDYMDEVSGMESDISPDGDSASVYAPLDEEDDHRSNNQQHQDVMRPDINMDDYDNEPDYNCSSCGHNDGYRGGYPYHSQMHPEDVDNDGYYDHRNYSDEYPPMNGAYVPAPGYDDMDEQGYDVDENGNYVRDKDDSDVVENYSNSNGGSYNYALWLLLIVLVVVLYMHYQKTQNASTSALPQF